MAKQNQGVNGAYNGKVGTVIGYQWRGKWCVRAKPCTVENPRSEAQQLNRALFAEKVRFAATMKQVLKVGFHDAALEAHVTEANLFLRTNRPCFSMESTGLKVDYGSLVVSVGEAAPVGFGEVRREGAGKLLVPFEPNPLHRHVSGYDKVLLYAYCPEKGGGELSMASYRQQGRAIIELPEEWAGMTAHLYGLVQLADGTTSDSFYIDEVTVSFDEVADAPAESGEAPVAAEEAPVAEPAGQVEQAEAEAAAAPPRPAVEAVPKAVEPDDDEASGGGGQMSLFGF